jgi:glycosyltransferase involved in cell wall biosynthesis
MSKVSGFHPLCLALEEVCGNGNTSTVEVSVELRPELRIFRYLRRLGIRAKGAQLQGIASSPWVLDRHEWAAQKVLKQAQTASDALILLTAGENQFGVRFRHAPPEIRRRMVVCLHQSPSWFRLHWRDFGDLDGLGALVCLCEEQRKFLSEMTSTPVLEIRHGVRHEFFYPEPLRKSGPEMRLLFVGQWLRDFKSLRRSMELIWKSFPNVTLDCVVLRNVRDDRDLSRLALDTRVAWHSDLSAEGLRSLYQRATLLFLPLLDATANNTVVEAMACGLPIVSTMVGGIIDYLPKDGGELCHPHDAEAYARAVLELLADSDRRARAGMIVRREVETNLKWETIARKLVTELSMLPAPPRK